MASTQFNLTATPRADDQKGKGAAGRLRATGVVPGIVYGTGIEPTAVTVDNRELYHALHTSAGRNVLIRLDVDGSEHLTVVKDLQTHVVRGDYLHVDFQAVSRDQLITAEIPVSLVNEDSPANTGGIVNLVLYTVPIRVRPLEVPDDFTLDLAGMTIGDVLRVEALTDQLPDGATFDVDEERTLVTINAPMSEEELDELAEGAGIEEDMAETELVGEEPAEGAAEDTAAGGEAEGAAEGDAAE
jgi:large subunit ribosomal protein L25